MTIKGKDLIEHTKDKEYSKELIKELEKYEIRKPKTVWELQEGDDYWDVYFDGEYYTVGSETFRNGSYDRECRLLCKAHLTPKRAELHARVLNTELDIKEWKRENDNVEWDWKDEHQYKYNFIYDAENEKIHRDYWRTVKLANTIYFSSRDKAKQCINDIGEERIIEWIMWEDNDQ